MKLMPCDHMGPQLSGSFPNSHGKKWVINVRIGVHLRCQNLDDIRVGSVTAHAYTKCGGLSECRWMLVSNAKGAKEQGTGKRFPAVRFFSHRIATRSNCEMAQRAIGSHDYEI